MGVFSWLFRAPEPPPTPIDHPVLGRIECRPEEGWWEGTRSVRDHLILRFSVSGTRRGPDDALVGPLEQTLQDWATIELKIHAFLEPRLVGFPQAKVQDFTPTDVVYLWPGKPDHFWVDLSMAGDEYAIWRIEFEQGEPKYLGRDD